jgi:hypothetical protein
MELPRSYVSQVLSTTRTKKYFFTKTCLARSSSVYHSGSLIGVTRKILVTGTKFNQTSMAGPLGVLRGVLTAATIVVLQDVDGVLPGGAAGSSNSGHHRS